MVELVDTKVSKTFAARRAGSSPAPGTIPRGVKLVPPVWFEVDQRRGTLLPGNGGPDTTGGGNRGA